MSWTYGSSPIPYGLNRAIYEATGRTFEALYEEWEQHLRDAVEQLHRRWKPDTVWAVIFDLRLLR